MRMTVVGCGDAFGSGGRGNACFWVEAEGATVALDFGATSLVALKRMGLDPRRLDAIVISHLHGDHFGGLPFFLLDAQFDCGRTRPLTIVGPVGTGERLRLAMEVFFPGSSENAWRFPLAVIDLPCGEEHGLGPLSVRTTEVVHPSGAPSTAVRLTDGRQTIAYSGDTRWTEALVEVARGADLFVVECFDLADAPGNHLDLATLDRERARLGVSRLLLTHMGPAVLRHIPALEAKGYLPAHDGLTLDLAPRERRRAAPPPRRAAR